MPVKNPNDRTIYDVKRASEQIIAKIPGVTGIYTGRKTVGGVKQDTLAIVVVVTRKLKLSELRPEEVVPTEIEGFPTDVVVGQVPDLFPNKTGIAESADEISTTADPASEQKFRRPLVGGSQISSLQGNMMETGTLGCFVSDQANNYYALSCSHVVGPVGNSVFQPDPTNATNAIGTVTQSVQNTSIDAGLTQINANLAFQNYVLKSGSIQGSYDLTASDLPSYVVQKCGRTTGFTIAEVTSIDYTVIVNGNPFKTDQILITDVDGLGRFSTNGDSGSVIMNDHYQVVGLLWGGVDADKTTFASPISTVLSALDIKLVTDHYPPLYAVHDDNGTSADGWCYQAKLTDTWSADSKINPFNPLGVENSPGLAVYRDKVYNIRQGRGGHDVWCSIFDGATWSADMQLAPTGNPENTYGTMYAPGTASYYGELYGVHQGTSGNSLWWFKYSNKVWSDDQPLPYLSSFGTSLVAYNGTLFSFRTGTDSCLYADLYTWSQTGSAWEEWKISPQNNPSGSFTSYLTPSAVTYNGLIYCFYKKSYSDLNIYFTTYDGKNWSAEQTVMPSSSPSTPVQTYSAPSAVVWNNGLFCFFIDSTSQEDVHYTFLSAGVWHDDTKTGFQSNFAPAFASLPTYLHVDFDLGVGGLYLFALIEGEVFGLSLSSPTSWVRNFPAGPPENRQLLKLYDQSPPNETLFAIDQFGALQSVSLYPQPSHDWVTNYPSIPPVPFAHVEAVCGGMFGTPGWIFGMTEVGNLYCCETPNGAWVQNFPDTQPTRFKQLCSIQQGGGAPDLVPGYLLALDLTGNIWAIAVPGGKWSSTFVPKVPVPMQSIAVAQWMVMIKNGDPVIATNVYGLDDDRNFWGCQLGASGWAMNYPCAPPAQLAKFITTSDNGRTYAADLAGNFYILNPNTNQWQTNYPAPLPQPE